MTTNPSAPCSISSPNANSPMDPPINSRTDIRIRAQTFPIATAAINNTVSTMRMIAIAVGVGVGVMIIETASNPINNVNPPIRIVF